MFEHRANTEHFQALEKRYNCFIFIEEYFDYFNPYRLIKRYKIVTADGNKWVNGLTYRGLQHELKVSADALRGIEPARWIKRRNATQD